MPANDFLPFGVGPGDDATSQGDYTSATWRIEGWRSGILPHQKINKVLRQSSSVTHALAQVMSEVLAEDVLDASGSVTALTNQMRRLLTANLPFNELSTYAPGSVGSGLQRALSGGSAIAINPKALGARGDGSDDWAPIQSAINLAIASGYGWVHLPPAGPGSSYGISQPLTFSAPIMFTGAGPRAVTLMALGFGSNVPMLKFDLGGLDGVDHVHLEGMTLRSLDGAPMAIYMRNVAYLTTRRMRLYHVKNGIVMAGARCYTHDHEMLTCYDVTEKSVQWAPGFNGGGQFGFRGCTFSGDVGMFLPSTAWVDNISMDVSNFEQCISAGGVFNGTLPGFSFKGSRTEGCDGPDFIFRPTLSTEFIAGIDISGNVFGASDANGAHRIEIGGDAGKVRGFSIKGNTVTSGVGGDYATSMVLLNGDGSAGEITGNYIQGHTASGAAVVNTRRPGVVVHANENWDGLLPESWGNGSSGDDEGSWTPVDGSGAAISFTSAGGSWTRRGREVFWTAYVAYPVGVVSTAPAEIGGFPFTIGGLTGVSDGRAGGGVDVTDAGIPIALLQGLTSSNEFALKNPTTGADILNSALSGKYLYLSGQVRL
jgi:hypothetical protein